MKNLNLLFTIICFALFTLGTSTAFAATSVTFNGGEPSGKLPKPIAYNYTGYCVQILEVDKELTEEHSIFRSFGDIKIEREGTQVYYLVGEFKSEQSAEEYMNKVIVSRFPGAMVARYKDGVRIDLDE